MKSPPVRSLALVALLVTLPSSAPAADLEAIRARGTLRVLASTDDNPAWFSAEKGAAHPGFERELLEGFARLNRLEFQVVPAASWDRVIPDLIRDKADVIAGINDTEARRRQIAFTAELLPARHLVVTRAPSPRVETAEQLREQKVCSVAGTTWAEAIVSARVPASRIETQGEVADCLASLRAGRSTATVLSVADFLLQRRTDPVLADGMTLGPAVSSAWGVRKGDVELKAALDAYLQNFKKSPGWSRLIASYFGEDSLRVLGRVRAP